MSVFNGLFGGSGPTDASVIHYDNRISGLEAAVVQDAVDELATLNRSDFHKSILLADNWSGRKAPFTYRLSVDGITEESTVYVSLLNDAPAEQVELVSDALLDVSGIGAGYVDIISRGNKLQVDIPVAVYVCNVVPVPRGRDAYYIKYEPPGGSDLTATTVGDAINQLCYLMQNSGLGTDATHVSIDDTFLNTGAKNVQEALEYFASHGTTGPSRRHVLTNIMAGSWDGDAAPYTTSIEIAGVTDRTEATVTAQFEITMDQYQALSHAEIVTGCTSTGRVVLKAFGEKPKIDIPVDISVYL